MKITKAQFERFKKAFIEWQNKLGLTDYRVDFYQIQLKNNLAEIKTYELGKVASVCLTINLCKLDSESWAGPEQTAKHEAIHLLLRRVHWLAHSRHCSEDDIDEEDERIVRRLENILK